MKQAKLTLKSNIFWGVLCNFPKKLLLKLGLL